MIAWRRSRLVAAPSGEALLLEWQQGNVIEHKQLGCVDP